MRYVVQAYRLFCLNAICSACYIGGGGADLWVIRSVMQQKNSNIIVTDTSRSVAISRRFTFALHDNITWIKYNKCDMLCKNIYGLFVVGSNPGTASKLWQFRLPHFASVFRKRRYKPSVPSIWCLCQWK